MNVSKTVTALTMIFAFAMLIQFLINRIKVIVGEKVMHRVPADVWAAALGILFAFVFKINIFIYLGITSANLVVCYIVTGLILSAGAPAIHELVEGMRDQRKSLISTDKKEEN